MALKTNAEKIRQGYINACNAVLGRGGSIASGAPIDDLADAIINIPFDASLAYHEVNSTAYRTLVPQNAKPYARINKIGGKSYKTRNLIPFPYVSDSFTSSDGTISYTVLDDGGIEVVANNPTKYEYFTLYGGYAYQKVPIPDWLQKGKTYTISSNIDKSVALFEVNFYKEDGTTLIRYDTSSFSVPDGYSYFGIFVAPSRNTTNTFTFYGMLNEGDTALPYEPYFEGLRDTKVTALESEGANLIPFPYADGAGKTQNGITFTVNSDRSISVKGTATANATFYFVRNLQVSADNYYISGEGDIRGYKVDVNDNITYFNKGAQIFDQLYYISMYVVVLEGDTVDYTVYPMLNRGTTAVPYKPYVGTLDILAIPEAVQSIYGYGWGVSENFNSYITPSSGKFTRHTERQLVKDSAIVSTSISGKPYLAINLQNTVYGNPFGYGVCDGFEIVRDYASELTSGQAMISRSENRVFLQTDMSVEDFKAQYADTVIEYALAEPVVTDISEYITDEFIKVEGGGTITAVNEHEEGAPTSVTYLIETVGG